MRPALGQEDDMKGIIRRYRNDIILVGSLMLAALALFLAFRIFSAEGGSVRVTVDGELYGIYSLGSDAEIDINGTNTLTISGGKAYMSWAGCPHRTCVLRGAVSKSGQSIVCLPNGVVVSVTGGDGGADAVTN